jgi:hypothetical protein
MALRANATAALPMLAIGGTGLRGAPDLERRIEALIEVIGRVAPVQLKKRGRSQ